MFFSERFHLAARRRILSACFFAVLTAARFAMTEVIQAADALEELAHARHEITEGRSDQAYERIRRLNPNSLANDDNKVPILLASAELLLEIGRDEEFSTKLLDIYKMAPPVTQRQETISMLADYAIGKQDTQRLEKIRALTEQDPACRIVLEEAQLRQQFAEKPSQATLDLLGRFLERNPGNQYLATRVRQYCQIATVRQQYRLALQCMELVSKHYPELAEDPTFELNMAAAQWNSENFSGALLTANNVLAVNGDEFFGVHNAYWILAISSMSLGQYDAAEGYLAELEERLDTYTGGIDFTEQIQIRRREIAAATMIDTSTLLEGLVERNANDGQKVDSGKGKDDTALTPQPQSPPESPQLPEGDGELSRSDTQRRWWLRFCAGIAIFALALTAVIVRDRILRQKRN